MSVEKGRSLRQTQVSDLNLHRWRMPACRLWERLQPRQKKPSGLKPLPQVELLTATMWERLQPREDDSNLAPKFPRAPFSQPHSIPKRVPLHRVDDPGSDRIGHDISRGCQQILIAAKAMVMEPRLPD